MGPQHGAGLDPVEAVVEVRGLEVPESHPGRDAEHLAPHRPRHRLAQEPLQLALDGGGHRRDRRRGLASTTTGSQHRVHHLIALRVEDRAQHPLDGEHLGGQGQRPTRIWTATSATQQSASPRTRRGPGCCRTRRPEPAHRLAAGAGGDAEGERIGRVDVDGHSCASCRLARRSLRVASGAARGAGDSLDRREPVLDVVSSGRRRLLRGRWPGEVRSTAPSTAFAHRPGGRARPRSAARHAPPVRGNRGVPCVRPGRAGRGRPRTRGSGRPGRDQAGGQGPPAPRVPRTRRARASTRPTCARGAPGPSPACDQVPVLDPGRRLVDVEQRGPGARAPENAAWWHRWINVSVCVEGVDLAPTRCVTGVLRARRSAVGIVEPAAQGLGDAPDDQCRSTTAPPGRRAAPARLSPPR